MTLTLRANATATAEVLNGKLSASRGGRLAIQLGAVGDPHSLLYIAFGPAPATPATYADFVRDDGGTVPLAHSGAVVTFNQDSEDYSVVVTVPVDADQYDMGASIYVAAFTTGDVPPAGSAVPDAVAGPFTVIA